MPTFTDLADYCDARTRRSAFTDSPGAGNGLQFASPGPVTRIGAAVDAGVVPFQRAVAAGVDFLLVHHGMYWDMPRPLIGPAYERVATLVRGRCALYSSHLPLDAHPQIGNNGLLARQVGLVPHRGFLPNPGGPIGAIAPFGAPRAVLRERLAAFYPRMLSLEYGPAEPPEVAFCSGSGHSALAGLEGVSTLVTGEIREEDFNRAQEEALNLYVCGHYATEVHGVKALAAELSAHFGLPWTFVETENPL